METITPDLRTLTLPFRLLGMNLGKTVSVITFPSGDLLIHSTANFDASTVQEIQNLGNPRWILEATNFHDTTAKKGSAAFPEADFYAPEAFPKGKQVGSLELTKLPPEWKSELEVIKIDGMPGIDEHIVFHHPSKTLIVADLLFNIPDSADLYTRKGIELVSGIKSYPGNSRLFRKVIKDQAAFTRSLEKIADLDFERIIVGHGDPITTNAKEALIEIFEKLNFSITTNS